MKLDDVKVSLSQLLLDPNNYRLDYDRDIKKFADEEIIQLQEKTGELLEKERLGELRESIKQNGFLEMDRIVVRELNGDYDPKMYVVVEGNRRTAAFKGLIADYEEGLIDLDTSLIEKTRSIGVICISGNRKEIERYSASLMGIRHVSGPKKWTGYQSARLIDELYNSEKPLSEIGSLLGISAVDAGRRRRGYKAFIQLRSDKNYGHKSQTNHYTLLLEFLSPGKSGREWLGWNEDRMRFENEFNRNRVYAAITSENGIRPEINNPNDAREFLRYLNSERHRNLIEDGVLLGDLPPLDDIDLSKEKKILDFLNFISSLNPENLTPIETENLKQVLIVLQDLLSVENAP